MPEKTPTPIWTFGTAYRVLAARQKAGAGVPFYTRVVNRRLGRVGAAAGAALGVTPHAVSLVGGALWAVALLWLCVVPASFPVVLGVVALLVVSFGLDSADGQLARLTGRTGRAGEWLDHVLDAARHIAVHLSVAVALHRVADLPGPGRSALVLPLLFALVSVTRFVAQILGEQLRGGSGRRPVQGSAASGGRTPGGASALIQLPADTGVLNASLLLMPLPGVFLAVYAVLTVANAVLLVATLRRRFAELAELDRVAAREDRLSRAGGVGVR
ncbi:CDP-alcohol phosphatidyltransferase family protein [Nocardioides panacihumi]|uniref:CDP-alcohol phosphatidyltransferase family protein n=1 Tax=Nocardioides panacihumi TaxID=400774 RepID=A0ABN2Q7G4_9ACTN